MHHQCAFNDRRTGIREAPIRGGSRHNPPPPTPAQFPSLTGSGGSSAFLPLYFTVSLKEWGMCRLRGAVWEGHRIVIPASRTLTPGSSEVPGGIFRMPRLPPSHCTLRRGTSQTHHHWRGRPPTANASRMRFPLVTAAHVTSTASPAPSALPAGELVWAAQLGAESAQVWEVAQTTLRSSPAGNLIGWMDDGWDR